MNPNYYFDKKRKHLKPSGHTYPQVHEHLAFSDYIAQVREMVTKARIDLGNHPDREKIIEANSPFEYKNDVVATALEKQEKISCGILLVHGLTASPVYTQDVARYFADQGYLVRSVLLPGHGTVTGDLSRYNYQDWLDVVAYGYQSLHQHCKNVFLFGISLGAVLCWLTVLNFTKLPCKGLLLCAPALELYAKNGWLARYPLMLSNIFPRLYWFKKSRQVPPVHYISLSYREIYQTHLALKLLQQTLKKDSVPRIPLFMTLADNDETINNAVNIQQFMKYATADSRLLIYSNEVFWEQDPKIITIYSHFPEDKIIDASHISLANSPTNYFYGKNSKYKYFDHYPDNFVPPSDHEPACTQGATIYKNLVHHPLRRITYNYDFDNFAARLVKFITALL